MIGLLTTDKGVLQIKWEDSCSILPTIKAHPSLEGTANNIQGEVFFYQKELDIPFSGEEKVIFEEGDVVYWKSATDVTKFAILLMYGNTVVADGTQIRTPSPGIKIGEIVNKEMIEQIPTGSAIQLI